MVRDVKKFKKYILWVAINIIILLSNKFNIKNIMIVGFMLIIELIIIFLFSRSSNNKKR